MKLTAWVVAYAVLFLALAFTAGFVVGKHRYECRRVGGIIDAPNGVVRTDEHVYRVCK